MENDTIAKGGVGIGTILAIVLSWSANHSVLWAIFHGILGWIYVFYYLFFVMNG